eukprot:4425322-Pyramimonas_sp.AAC.1
MPGAARTSAGAPTRPARFGPRATERSARPLARTADARDQPGGHPSFRRLRWRKLTEHCALRRRRQATRRGSSGLPPTHHDEGRLGRAERPMPGCSQWP